MKVIGTFNPKELYHQQNLTYPGIGGMNEPLEKLLNPVNKNKPDYSLKPDCEVA